MGRIQGIVWGWIIFRSFPAVQNQPFQVKFPGFWLVFLMVLLSLLRDSRELGWQRAQVLGMNSLFSHGSSALLGVQSVRVISYILFRECRNPNPDRIREIPGNVGGIQAAGNSRVVVVGEKPGNFFGCRDHSSVIRECWAVNPGVSPPRICWDAEG